MRVNWRAKGVTSNGIFSRGTQEALDRRSRLRSSLCERAKTNNVSTSCESFEFRSPFEKIPRDKFCDIEVRLTIARDSNVHCAGWMFLIELQVSYFEAEALQLFRERTSEVRQDGCFAHGTSIPK